MPNVIVISGPNGAGKSTLAPTLLRDVFGIAEFVNADTIAQELSASAPENSAHAAEKLMLSRLKELAAQQKDFALETTLATGSYLPWLKELQSDGYHFHLIYLSLKNLELAIERVETRVRAGGHDIPPDVIERGFQDGYQNFFDLYLPIADSWQFYDASFITPQILAIGDKIGGEKVFQKELWKIIKK
jgi:predicted ABC-type ATPase